MSGPSIHPLAQVDPGARIGDATTVWHYAHIMPGARVGERCMIGQGCYVASLAEVGNGCRIQNHVSIYDGVILEDDVFVGPSAVFTNVKRPRAAYPRKPSYETTRIGRGATIGANATVMCGVHVGSAAMIGAGSVVTHDVPPHAVVTGSPAIIVGWICACGDTLWQGAARPSELACLRCGPVKPS